MRRKSRRARKEEEDIEERLSSINTDKAGCEEIKGEFNKKSGQCDIRQLRNKDEPEQVTHKKFDSVKRADEIGGVQKVEDEQ